MPKPKRDGRLTTNELTRKIIDAFDTVDDVEQWQYDDVHDAHSNTPTIVLVAMLGLVESGMEATKRKYAFDEARDMANFAIAGAHVMRIVAIGTSRGGGEDYVSTVPLLRAISEKARSLALEQIDRLLPWDDAEIK